VDLRGIHGGGLARSQCVRQRNGRHRERRTRDQSMDDATRCPELQHARSLHPRRMREPLTSHGRRRTIPKLIMGTKPPMGELLPGTLDMLILKTLSRAPMHGYGIAQFIQRASSDVLRVEEGALYPALHRLEVRGWLLATWGTSDNNRRAKFYKLSALGRRELEAEADYWRRVASAVTQVMATR